MDDNSLRFHRDTSEQWGDRFTVYRQNTRVAEYVIGYYYGHHVLQVKTDRLEVFTLLYLHEDYDKDFIDAQFANQLQSLSGTGVITYSSGVVGGAVYPTGKIFLLGNALLGYVSTCPLPDCIELEFRASKKGDLTNTYYVQVLFNCDLHVEAHVARLLGFLYADVQARLDQQQEKQKCQETTPQLSTS